MEYHSFLSGRTGTIAGGYNGFPSPYGVSFILIDIVAWAEENDIQSKFPSPYGVSFILM